MITGSEESTTTTVILSAYPLSRGFRQRLEGAIDGRPVFLNLAHLRGLGMSHSLRTLRAHAGGRWLIALENEGTRALMPFLATSALIAVPKSIEVVDADARFERLSLRELTRSALQLLNSSVQGLLALVAARRQLQELSGAERAGTIGPPGDRRVLYVYATLWFGVRVGGSVGHVAGVVNALGDAGYSVDLATSIDPVMIRPPAKVLRLRTTGALGVPFEANYYRVQRQLVAQVRRSMPIGAHRFLYFRMASANYAGVLLSRALRIPLVAEYNGSEVWAARNWGSPLRYERQALLAEDVTLRHAHALVVVSDVLRDELLGRGIAAERIVNHPNGFDPRIFDPDRLAARKQAIRRDLGLLGDAILVTFVGTFGRWHGVDVLARAIVQLVSSERLWLERWKVRFLLIGDGQRMTEVRSILGEEIAPFTHLTGLIPQEKTPEYLAASDIVVSPHVANDDGSQFFGSPTKLFEYMAMGRGIVASDLGQIGQVLSPAMRVGGLPDHPPDRDDPRVAVLATPGDVTQLIDGVRFLVENPDWRLALGARARARALSMYTWRQHVAAILDRVNELSRPAPLDGEPNA